MTTTTDTRHLNSDPAIISTTSQSSVTLNPDTQNITITLAVDDCDLTDQLVITFAKSGSVACPEMLEGHSTSRLLYELERNGQNVTEPTLMAIADDDGIARRVFITPCPGANFRDYAVWVGLVTETVQNLKARKVALYPCPGSLSDDNVFELIAQLVRSLIEAKCTENIALIVGRYNYNRLLNLALELKTELRAPSTLIQVIH
jgi:hypothetical protein